jgi:ankyrin repeat protein
MLAARKGHLHVVNELLCGRAHVEKESMVCAYKVSRFRNITLMRTFMGFQLGITALMLAAQEGHLEVVKVLVQAGADVGKFNAVRIIILSRDDKLGLFVCFRFVAWL